MVTEISPFAVVERDDSVRGWEVATGIDDLNHTCVVVHYLDDGTTVIGLLSADARFLGEIAYDKQGNVVSNPIVRCNG